MDTIITWLLGNPSALAAAGILAALLLVALVAVFAAAFVQGRSVTFYPPSIGPKPTQSVASPEKLPLLTPQPERHIDESQLASIFLGLRDRSLPANIVGLVVESSITLQKCPNMRNGWKSDEIDFDHRQQHFTLPGELLSSYREYFREAYAPAHGSSQSAGGDDTLMLRRRPAFTGTDQPRLRLDTQLNLYSYSQFYWNIALTDPVRYRRALTDILEHGVVSFPHNLCIHLVVATSDDYILLSLRSHDVATHPSTWSCSIEENLKVHEDLVGNTKTTVDRWVGRALFEELGVTDAHFKEPRLLSVFLEGTPRLNIAMVGFVTLSLTKEQLSRVILLQIHPDSGEHKSHDYISRKQMAAELKSPSRVYHPTSRYRMLMALLHIYGEANFAREYLELVS